MRSDLRAIVHVILVLVLLSAAERPAAAQREATRVIVSREEARVIFAPDTATAWGWPKRRPDEYGSGYAWGALTKGLDGTRRIFLDVEENDRNARRFPSLEALVAAGETNLCPAGVIVRCDSTGTSAFVEGRSVVIRVRGPMVARMFALRPASISVWTRRPGEPLSLKSDSARVEYIDPQIPPPGATEQTGVARALREEEANARSVFRTIHAAGTGSGPITLVVGDSVMLRVDERVCRYDYCTGGHRSPADSGWTVGDSHVARLRMIPDTALRRFPSDGNVTLIATAPGRTTVRVLGIYGGADAEPSQEPPATSIEREVIVRERTPPPKPKP